MKKLFFLLTCLLSLTAFGQVSSFMYVKVAPENRAEFERLETTYWAEIAQKAIDDGKMLSWGLLREVGISGPPSNYIIINIFKDFESATTANGIWDPTVINMNANDISTDDIKEVLAVHYYQIEEVIQGNSKFSIHNYARPVNLEGFVQENINMWKPFIEKNIKEKKTEQVNWGLGTRVYPLGAKSGATVFTRDGFATLADAMEALSYKTLPADFQALLKKSKMAEYDPEGFQWRTIYEGIKWVN